MTSRGAHTSPSRCVERVDRDSTIAIVIAVHGPQPSGMSPEVAARRPGSADLHRRRVNIRQNTVSEGKGIRRDPDLPNALRLERYTDGAVGQGAGLPSDDIARFVEETWHRRRRA